MAIARRWSGWRPERWRDPAPFSQPVRWMRWPWRLTVLASRKGDPPADRAGGERSHVQQQARQGEFEAFFRRHEREIFTYVWRLTSDEASAYDLTQETFLRAWQNFDKVVGYERPGGWLFRVATNLALNHLRHRRTPLGGTYALGEHDQYSDDPTRGVIEHDLVRSALMALAPRQRAALVLREVYGLTVEELAAGLEVSIGAAKTLLWRARDEFRANYLGEADSGRLHRQARRYRDEH